MGRKPINKSRVDDKEIKLEWLQKFLPLFNQIGFRKFTMEQIAEKLGTSKSTIYKFFKSKEQIVSELIMLKLEEIGNYEKYLFDKTQAYNFRFLEAMEIATKGLTNISATFMKDIQIAYPAKWTLILQFKQTALQRLSDFYKEGIETGYINSVFNPDVLVKFDDMILTAMTDPLYLEKEKLELSELFHQYFLLKSQGVLIQSMESPELQSKIKKMESNLKEYSQQNF